MKVAIVGGGVSGLTAARFLASRHEVCLWEADDRPGGHAMTVDCQVGDKQCAVDVGFMVFNRRTYPAFCRLLDWLGVESRASDMSFSVSCLLPGEATPWEFQGSSLDGVFAERRNLLRPKFYRFISDVLRFNRDAARWLDASENQQGESQIATMQQWLVERRYGAWFIDRYLAPMTAAIWSAPPAQLGRFPAR
ncbi:MAG: FAD-dependent oxidoreductase, partial [Planctomycetales bacterium]|nr:FAD-dependent oxidoreductase [Planctomycetales bacterium]